MRILYTYPTEVPFTEIHFGLLYNAYAYRHANFAMSGWHVPTETEIIALVTALGGVGSAGVALREPDLTYWNNLNGCDNSSGMTMRGNGLRTSTDGSFTGLKTFTYLMSITLSGSNVRNYSINENNTVSLANANQKQGRNVVLLKDDSVDPGFYTDYEGHKYPTTKVGSQVWTAKNIITQYLNDGTAISEVTDGATWIGLTTPGLCAYNNDWNYV